jgi:hypothetical protein
MTDLSWQDDPVATSHGAGIPLRYGNITSSGERPAVAGLNARMENIAYGDATKPNHRRYYFNEVVEKRAESSVR